jgi:carboxymethylenebutenolidase
MLEASRRLPWGFAVNEERMRDSHDDLNPARSTSDGYSRRAFVGISGATATLLGASGALADDALGKPHPGLVAEDDPAIVVERPVLASARPGGAFDVDAYAAAPKAAGPTTPSLVVVMHVWGVDAQIRDTVRRLAKAGYATIAPNLYTGLGAPSGDGTSDFAPFREASSKLADASVDADLDAGATWLKSRGAERRLGVMGFCMGGSITLRQAVDKPETYRVASVFYGKVRYGTTDNNGPITPIALAYADEIAFPVVGSFGARDTGIKADDVRALSDRLTQLHKPHDIKVYEEAGHAFFDDTRQSYVASAAADAWGRTLAAFKRYLSP